MKWSTLHHFHSNKIIIFWNSCPLFSPPACWSASGHLLALLRWVPWGVFLGYPQHQATSPLPDHWLWRRPCASQQGPGEAPRAGQRSASACQSAGWSQRSCHGWGWCLGSQRSCGQTPEAGLHCGSRLVPSGRPKRIQRVGKIILQFQMFNVCSFIVCLHAVYGSVGLKRFIQNTCKRLQISVPIFTCSLFL